MERELFLIKLIPPPYLSSKQISIKHWRCCTVLGLIRNRDVEASIDFHDV